MPACHYCTKPAKFQCDAPLENTPKAAKLKAIQTCDRFLCEDHAITQSKGIACSRGRKPCCQTYTIDFCPEHAKRRTLAYAADDPYRLEPNALRPE